ncbi:hypothetical protein F8O06_01875 [Pseudoclavibacter sp. CFCC 14310]|uniref:hypothetical protein n=1 Tax=Pseudoclavibacter sp. CFCC 14310 TaxID=2615180 RepID=UPI001300DCD4|nr:hypothetical protein [Pseudoclavibacter sp. CFCC 14310]KAB1647338.1 hypothetical protein F8O06_01875 [Pseudoclavibacter sp. CFCC 14310]
MSMTLELSHEVLHDVGSTLSGAQATAALESLSRVQTAEGLDYGDARVQAALSQVGCALAAAARVLVEGCELGAAAARTISTSVTAADQQLGLSADALRAGAGE